MIEVFLVVVGLASLVGGGELLLRGAVNVAEAFGMSRLLIGLTIVSLGTSAPEMAICLDAALDGNPEIALGNIIGSNVANVLLILGITAIVMPIVVQREIIQKEVPIMIGFSLLFVLLVIDGFLSQIDGAILLTGMVGFLVWQFFAASSVSAKRNQESGDLSNANVDSPAEPNESRNRLVISVILILAGAVLLWLGAGWLVKGASGVAIRLGISQLVIGLTVVAIGSSAPEIVTSVLAARRGYPEMSVASVIGSNIANLLIVTGFTAVLSDTIMIPQESIEFDIPVMVICAIACLPIFTTGHRIVRWEGVLFLASYAAFTMLLLFRTRLTEIFPNWSQMVWPIATPLVIATVIAIAWDWKVSRNAK